MGNKIEVYKGKEPYIYISYAHKDSDEVFEYIGLLQKYGYRLWCDTGLDTAGNWIDEIPEHIDGCACVICFGSANYCASQTCVQELNYAVRKNKPTVIIQLDDSETFFFRFAAEKACKMTKAGNYSGREEVIAEISGEKGMESCLSPDGNPPEKKADIHEVNRFEVYEGDEPFVFISYAHKDSAEVLRYIGQLSRGGYRIWYDEGIEGGGDWPDIIPAHIEKSRCILCFISENYQESQNCMKELLYAQNAGISPIIVKLRNFDMARKLKMAVIDINHIGVSAYTDEDKLFKKISGSVGMSDCKIDDSFGSGDMPEAIVIPKGTALNGDLAQKAPKQPEAAKEIPAATIPPDLPELITVSEEEISIENEPPVEEAPPEEKPAPEEKSAPEEKPAPEEKTAPEEEPPMEYGPLFYWEGSKLHITKRLAENSANAFAVVFGRNGREREHYTVVIESDTKRIAEYKFNCCVKESKQFRWHGPESVYIGYNVMEIGVGAFFGCKKLRDIQIPQSVRELSDYSFSMCSSLEIAELPSGLKKIGRYAFNRCGRLLMVKMPNAVEEIGEYAFCRCASLCDIIIPDSLRVLGHNAFAGCVNVTTIYTDKKKYYDIACAQTGLTLKKPPYLWDGSDLLVSKELAESGKNIYEAVFGRHSEEPESYRVVIEEGTTVIPELMFFPAEVTKETKLCLSTAEDYIDFEEYYGVNYLTYPDAVPDFIEFTRKGPSEIIIPESVEKIGDYAFCGCYKIKELTIPEGVKEIGSHAFEGCINLKKVKLPESVTKLGNAAFCMCDGLSSVNFPPKLTETGTGAFGYCFRLTSVHIPGNIKAVGYRAFVGCKNLKEVTLDEGVTSIGKMAFDGCLEIEKLYLPLSVTEIGANAFDEGTSIQELTCSRKVLEIVCKQTGISEKYIKFTELK